MSDVIIVALISLIGTVVGSVSGVLISNRLTIYRIEQLEIAVKENTKLKDYFTELKAHNELQDQKMTFIEGEVKRLVDDVRSLKHCRANMDVDA